MKLLIQTSNVNHFSAGGMNDFNRLQLKDAIG